jgi:hypothetical protein
MRFQLEGAGVARLELSELPPAIATSRNYLDGVAGSIAAGFDLMGVKGEVEIERFDPLRRRACFRLEWEGRARRVAARAGGRLNERRPRS